MARYDLSRWFSGVGASSKKASATAAMPQGDAVLRGAVDNLPVTLFEVDAQGIYTCVAGGYLHLFGITPSQLIGRSIFDFPKFVPGKNMMVRRALAGEAVAFSGIWPRGRYMIRLIPRCDDRGRVVAVTGLGYDLGKPTAVDKHFEQLLEALRQSEARFRAMCENAPLGIYVCTTRLELGYVNPALYQLLQRRPDELVGRNWQVLLHPEERERLAVRSGARDSGVHQGVLCLAHEDGSPVWTSLRMAEMVDDGEPIGFVGAVVDISQERAARLASERVRQDLRRVIECSPEGIAVVRDEHWVYVNRALSELLGHPRSEALLGTHATELVHPEDRARLFALIRDPQADVASELRYRRANGDYVLLEVRQALLSEFEGAPALLLAAHDISERKNLQAQLVVTERLLSMGTLAAGVAHEINNPLAAVLSNLEWVCQRLKAALPSPHATGSELPASVLGPIEEAREAAGRVRAIVSDLKVFSRVEEERMSPVDLTHVLDSAVRMAWNELRHRARLVRDYGDLPRVYGNEARLGQVFLNLIINAAQAIPEGRASDHQIALSARTTSDDQVMVEVRDTGCGIPREVLGRIFDPFFTTKPAGVGSGLGLSICQRIVNGMGGQIEVDSAPGRGSVFRVTFAAMWPEQRAAETLASAAPVVASGARGRVLVIDDDPAMGNAIELVLTDDHEVEVFTSARRALARLATGISYDAIVCDVMMPEMSGMDFHAELARGRPELAEQIIFLTGGAFTLRAREFLDGVGNPRLDKPFDSQSLRSLVNSQVARAP